MAYLKHVPDEYKSLVHEQLLSINKHIANHKGGYKWKKQDFEFGSVLGTGRFGKVYLARQKTTKFMVALKRLNNRDFEDKAQAARELDIHSRLCHPHIVQFFTFFYNAEHIYIVMEFAPGGNLHTALINQFEQRFSENLTAKYIYQVADALEYCHQKGVIHRDVKPENVLLMGQGDIKLADFGWSVLKSLNSKQKCGTTEYMSPEMVTGKVYSTETDNWALGVLCHELLVGKTPFLGVNDNGTITKIVNVSLQWTRVIKPDAKDLISKLLKLRPKDRLSLVDVMKHVWVLKHKDEKL